MSKELAKTYDPAGIEDRLYKKWEDKASELYSVVYETLVD